MKQYIIESMAELEVLTRALTKSGKGKSKEELQEEPQEQEEISLVFKSRQ